jgi:hypothetical protein
MFVAHRWRTLLHGHMRAYLLPPQAVQQERGGLLVPRDAGQQVEGSARSAAAGTAPSRRGCLSTRLFLFVQHTEQEAHVGFAYGVLVASDAVMQAAYCELTLNIVFTNSWLDAQTNRSQ